MYAIMKWIIIYDAWISICIYFDYKNAVNERYVEWIFTEHDEMLYIIISEANREKYTEFKQKGINWH